MVPVEEAVTAPTVTCNWFDKVPFSQELRDKILDHVSVSRNNDNTGFVVAMMGEHEDLELLDNAPGITRWHCVSFPVHVL